MPAPRKRETSMVELPKHFTFYGKLGGFYVRDSRSAVKGKSNEVSRQLGLVIRFSKYWQL